MVDENLEMEIVAMAKSQNVYPTTIDEAVRLLQGLIADDETARIAILKEGELSTLHFGLGQWLRNQLGLWGDNQELVAATGEQHADDASRVIVHAFWSMLRDELPKVH